MATKLARKRDLACVRIGFEEYLLDADKAMQAIKLFRESVRCRRHFAGSHKCQYVVGEKPELELMLVDAEQVLMPRDLPAIGSDVD
ncbi:hypothetical protein [Paraburkholderia humisilvae]|uniref:Uncharacterized protein n=1 Tax=Paraburkholderia humisilvae TaxID=627669 RepID=A0A6J5EFR1_9BURK|nr:hypothetical protein [Paraburkholderia humisilvae]CAB3764191.1 hypothetical protein LMG29542_04808 [Paraburkholderia humisilvae]